MSNAADSEPVAETPPPRRGFFDALKSHNFRLFATGQFVTQVGFWLGYVSMSLIVLDYGGGGFGVGVLTVCNFLPVLILGGWAGVVVDRTSKRLVLAVGQVGAMIYCTGMAAVSLFPDASVWWIYGLALVSGVTMSFVNPARSAFVLETVGTASITNAISLNNGIMTIGRMIGPVLAGLLVETVGYFWCFVVDGVAAIGVVIALALARTHELRPAPRAAKARGQIREGFAYAARTPDVRDALVPILFVSFTVSMTVTYPVFMLDSLGGSESDYTILFAIVSIGSMAGALLAARFLSPGLGVIARQAAFYAAAIGAFAFAPGVLAAIGLAIIVGFASSTFQIAASSTVQSAASPDKRGRVMSLQGMVSLGTAAIGGPFIGWLADATDPRAAVLLGACGALLAACYALVAHLRAKRAGNTVMAS